MAAGIYTTTTLAQAVGLLAARLMDPTNVHWTSDELAIYLQQALRIWNALTTYYRDQGSFQTAVGVPFYDLPTVLPALRGQTYTDGQALTELAYHLLEEPPTGATWNGSNQFTEADLVNALQEARDRFLLETGIVINRLTYASGVIPANGRLALDESIVNVRRVAWQTADNIVTVLRRDDEWSLSHFAPVSWNAQAATRPSAYSVGETPPLTLQIAPVPITQATVDLLVVQRGPTIDPANPQTFGVPNDWAWVPIFGALEVLLNRDGLAYDPARASYSRARWTQGVTSAKAAAVVLQAYIGSQVVGIGSVADADQFSNDWQTIQAVPRRVMLAGQTVLGAWPVPGVPTTGGSFTIALDLVRNAPVPIVGGDFLQVGPELLDTILDYAQHLALFKEGPALIAQSQGLLDSFMAAAGIQTGIDWALSPNRQPALGQTQQDRREEAYETTNAGTIN